MSRHDLTDRELNAFRHFLPAKRTKTVMGGIVRLFDEDSSLLKTFTFDSGTEFTGHKVLQEKLGLKTYFADPFCSGQRGTNENTNGLVRQ